MERATNVQRIGVFVAFVEACLFGFVAALHFGLEWHVGGMTFAAPFLYPAGIMEAVVGLMLLVAVASPGSGAIRTGRVLAAQILAVIGVFVGQIALMRGAELSTPRREIFDGVALVLALTSIVLISSPLYRRHTAVRR